MKIQSVRARQILDSRGNPTVEADVYLEDGTFGRAAVPSGASKGSNEVLELRDESSKAYGGKGVLKAVENVNTQINKLLTGKVVTSQKEIDTLLIDLDGTANKSKLGANALLAVSMAVSKTAAQSLNVKPYVYYASLIKNNNLLLPLPIFNIFNGGLHAGFATDIQEYILFPVGAKSFSQALQIGAEVFQNLKLILIEKGYAVTVGDEGGFAPKIKNGNDEPLFLISQAVERAGYKLGEDVAFGLDVAATVFFKNNKYELKSENKSLSSKELVEWYVQLVKKYPVISIEDGLAENDWQGWTYLMSELGNKIQIVGDDLLVTNVKFIQKAIEEKSANAVIIKPNQIGTVTETIDSILLAKKAGFNTIMSHRSGETEDTTISHMAVGFATGQIKTGSVSRSDRIAKYNELLRIEEELGASAIFAHPHIAK